jgi:hypothetical protein
VFAFDEDLSAEQTQTESFRWTFEQTHGGVNLSHGDIAWGTVTVEEDGGHAFSDAVHFHGNGLFAGGTSNHKYVDYKNGSIVTGVLGEAGSESFSGWDITYKYITGSRRLKRTGVTDAVDIRWWGAPALDPNDPQHANPEISWAINKAMDLRDNGSFDWVYVDIYGEHYWGYMFRIPDGVMLRGAGPVREDGFTRGMLQLLPNHAAFREKDGWTKDDDPYTYISHTFTTIMYSKFATKVGMMDLELNGNIDNNMQIFDGTYGNIWSHLQDSGDYAAFYIKESGAWVHGDPMEVHFNNMVCRDFGGNCVAQDGAGVNWISDNVLLDTAYRNHLSYGIGGTFNNWTAEGTGWASLMAMGEGDRGNYNSNFYTTFNNLTWKNLETNPNFVWSELSDIRADNVTVDGFTVDLRGSTNTKTSLIRLTTLRGSNALFKDGTIYTLAGLEFALAITSEVGLPPGGVFENIQVIDQGGPGVYFVGPYQINNNDITFKDITVTPAAGVTNPVEVDGVLGFTMVDSVAGLNKSKRMDFVNVSYQRPVNDGLVGINGGSGPNKHPQEVFLVDSDFEISGNQLIRRPGSNADERTPRVFFDNVTLDVPTPGYGFHKWLGEDAVARMRNCQDPQGRVSDATGTYTSDSSDEGNDYVLIPTSLMSFPGEFSVTVNAGGLTVASVEIANADGSTTERGNNYSEHDPYLRVNLSGIIGVGDTITLDWAARVTPLSEYQTTGLFIARHLNDRTLGGTETIDLRGVASSQESKEAITYTASSDNTSVVTASVQSDGISLDLSEQGSGSATITVTAEITGVGVAMTTFAITVE